MIALAEGHGPWRVASHSRIVLRHRRAAAVGRPRADASDRLGLGHVAGHRSDGAHRRGRGADASGGRRARASSRRLRSRSTGRDFVARRAPRRDARDLRIAYCPDIAGIGIDPDVERVCRDAAFALTDAGATVEDIDLDLSEGRQAFLSLRGLWFVTQMFPRLDKQDRFGPNVGNNVRSGLKSPRKDLAAAEDYRGRLWHPFRDFFIEHSITC